MSESTGFLRLHVELTIVSYHEISGGDLQAVVRLEALGIANRPAKLEVLTHRWKTEGGKHEIEWKARQRAVPISEIQSLVAALARKKARPRVETGPTGNTTWDGITLTVTVDDSEWMLRLIPLDSAKGEDFQSVLDVLRKLASVAGLTAQDGLPRELTNP